MNILPDDAYYHSLFGSDNEKCPPWFAIGLSVCMLISGGFIGLVLFIVFAC